MTGAGSTLRIGLGCMRLSTDPERDEARAIAVIHAALDAGIALLDTADAYGWNEQEMGHNERLIARALASWRGDRARVEVATKGGLTRPGGRWVPDGRARHLTSACEASLRALEVAHIDLYQLHAPDPKTPLATSVRALASLQRAGLVKRVGLCNVTVGQIEEARQIVDVAAVQVRLDPFHDENLRNQVTDCCEKYGIRLLAHSPLGGPKGRRRIARDPALVAVAKRHRATPFEVALAWVRRLAPVVEPIPGATRQETARSCALAARIELGAEDVAELSQALPSGFAMPPRAAETTAAGDRDVVLLMGYPAAGKTTAVREFVERGYERLNRDEMGGRLAGIAALLDRALRAGGRRFVLDNTYPSRRSRSAVIEVAARHGAPVRCVWLETSLEDAQVNACERLIARYGRLPPPDVLARLSREDPNAFPPQAQFRYRRDLEPPDMSEGFAAIATRPFARQEDPASTQRALFVDLDGILWRSRRGARSPLDPDDVEVIPGRAAVLRRYRDEGWLLLGISWQPAIAEGVIGADVVEACLARAQELLELEIEVAYCPHGPGPQICWCRKPLPGIGVAFIRKHQLDRARSLHVGRGPHDRTFAERIGFAYLDHMEVFAAT